MTNPFTAVARSTDPATSHDAAASVTRIRESQQHVLAVFRRHGDMTDEVLLERYRSDGRPQQSDSGLRTRRRELADAGVLHDSGRRETLATGRSAIVWSEQPRRGVVSADDYALAAAVRAGKDVRIGNIGE